MNLLDKLSISYQYVCDNSKNVRINYEKVDEMIEGIKSANICHWLDSNPFGINDMDSKQIIDYLLILHTIGDYCFWGDLKWEVETPDGLLDGSYAMMYVTLKRFKENENFDMSFEDFKKLLKGNTEIPLLTERYNSLVTMNKFLEREQKPFHEIIDGMNNDYDLMSFLISNLSYYQDISIYDEHQIAFYKRAQLITSDILHVKREKEGLVVDDTNLIGCADYKIPQVMRCYGMLEFSEELAAKVDSKTPIEEGTKEEIEIRANTLKVIDYICKKLNNKYSHMEINDYIWLLGQDKSKMTKPYHRTLTIHY